MIDLKNKFGLLTALLLLVSLFATCQSSQAKANDGSNTENTPPNIIVMMADDMGFSDLGCYGSEIPTPNLDQLAADGVRLTDFYNTSRCCPSRATILTGLYSHQTGMGHMNYADTGQPGYRGHLTKQVATIPEMLRPAGYSTFMVGKWHLTLTKTIKTGPNGTWPTQRGFDHFFGTLEGAKDYFRPQWLFDDQKEIKDFEDDFFYTKAISNRAANYITQHPKDKPFFMYVAFYAPHFPLQAPAADIAKFRGKYMQGWDKIREQRFKRQLESGVIPKGTKLSRRHEKNPAWQSLDEKVKDDLDHRMATYAAQIHGLDRGAGRIIDALKASNRLDNTLILFCSDNGGAPGKPLGDGELNPTSADSASLVRYGSGWSNASNTPYFRYKGETHEGGIRSPLIMHWPAKLTRPNRVEKKRGHLIDIAATCLDAAGVAQPKEFEGQRIKPIEGTSLLPILLDKSDSIPDRSFFFEHQGWRGVIGEDYKLVSRRGSGKWQLFHVATDRTESTDVYHQHKEIGDRMKSAWDAWAKRCNVKKTAKSKDLGAAGGQKPNRKPNILWIISDDLSPDLGCYGAPAVNTTNVDWLASAGLRFTRAYASSPVCSPSRSAFVTGMYQTTLGAHHHNTHDKPTLKKNMTVMEHFKNAGYFVTNQGKEHYNFNTAFKFDGKDWTKRKPDQPFFAQIQIKEPHRNFVKNTDPTRAEKIELPPRYPDHPVTRADWANYLASIEVMDQRVGEVIQQLKQEKVLDNTAIFFFGDHGRPHVWGKQWLYEGGTKVPLIVRLPPGTQKDLPHAAQKGKVDQRMISLIDVAPTSLAVAGIPVPETMQGQNFLASDFAGRKYIYTARDRCGDAVDRIRSVRDERFKLIRNSHPELAYWTRSSYKRLQYPVLTLMEVLEKQGKLTRVQSRMMQPDRPAIELYDLKKDPFETVNLAGLPHVSKFQNELIALLDHWEIETDDQGRIDETKTVDLPNLLKAKQKWFNKKMKERGLDGVLEPAEYLQWWEAELKLNPADR